MKTLILTLATLASTVGMAGVAVAVPVVPPTQASNCIVGQPVINVSGINNVTASGSKIVLAKGTIATVTGNTNCIVADNRGAILTVKGNNNYTSAKSGVYTMQGTNNTTNSTGSSIMNGGGGTCVGTVSDIKINCL